MTPQLRTLYSRSISLFTMLAIELNFCQEDMRLLRPTVFGATPVLWAGLYQAYQAALAEAVRGASSPNEAELELRAQWKAKLLLGNRCRLGIIGGAASSPALRNWIFTLLNCVVVDGYGTTETGGLAGSGEVKDGTNLQLIDCPGTVSHSSQPFIR